ncbi:MAG: dihydropteroate synthase [Nitrospiraceae bacterium]
MLTSFSIRACGRSLVALRPQVVAVLNITPDSFSDGGRYLDQDAAVARAEQLVADGADWLDIGAESTRPGAQPVGEEEETARLLPVLERVAARVTVPISVDTMKAAVARRALDAGAIVVNDVSALRADPAMASLVAERGAGLVLMHMQGTPQTMQQQPQYEHVLSDVRSFLRARLREAVSLGITPDQIVLDPGIGFGKLGEHNLALLRHLPALGALGRPIMIGVSRKAFLGKLTGRAIDERGAATATAVALAVERGAQLLRVHDVKPVRDAVAVTMAVCGSNTGPIEQA